MHSNWLFVAMVTFGLVTSSYGGTKTKCQVVAALRSQGVPDSDLRDWLCLVQNESGYEYDAINDANDNGSIDYGIFQLNSNYWCDQPDGISGSTCWKFNTYGCADSCSSFLDSDITNDANCAVRIKNCNGFYKWEAHKTDCSDVSGPDYDYSDCGSSENIRLDITRVHKFE